MQELLFCWLYQNLCYAGYPGIDALLSLQEFVLCWVYTNWCYAGCTGIRQRFYTFARFGPMLVVQPFGSYQVVILPEHFQVSYIVTLQGLTMSLNVDSILVLVKVSDWK